MSTIRLLNNKEHKHLRVKTERSAQYGDAAMFSLTFPLEFRSIQAHYPILFQKDKTTGDMQAVSLFGFEQDENLYLDGAHWDAGYIPLSVQRQPFSIGVQSMQSEESQRVLHINVASKRVSESEGERLFDDVGMNTPFLDRCAAMLETIHQWNEHAKLFFAALEKYELLESVSLDVKLQNGTSGQLLGFYTINESKLNALSAEALGELNQSACLQPIYMALASLSNIQNLAERKNRKHLAMDAIAV